MRPSGRTIVFGLFATVGAALAVCVAVSSGPSQREKEERKNSPKPVAATVDLKRVPRVADSPFAAKAVVYTDRRDSAASVLGPTLVESGRPYAQRASLPVQGDVSLPTALDQLRTQLNNNAPPPGSVPPPSTPTAAQVGSPSSGSSTTVRDKTTVLGAAGGKLSIHIFDEDLRKVLDLLGEQGNLNILASKNVQGRVSATLKDVDIDNALKAILKSTGYVSRHEANFIFVGTPEDFTNIEQGMDRLGTRVYRTNYITAAELNSLVKPLLTPRVGVSSVSSAAEGGIASSDAGSGGNKFSGGEVLLVRDFEAVLSQIDQLATEVDVRPLQVSIEAMILSVKLSDSDSFGVNFQLLRDNPNIKFGFGSPATSLSNFTLDGGLKFGFLDSSLGAFIEALETVGETNVVANPRLMVLNKQRAEVQIGEKKGYVNQTMTSTSTTQSVEFLDIGAQLRLRPFISSDGLIRMEIHPELSDGDVKVDTSGTSVVTLPNKELTQVTTNIMVRDGCTVVIGGLIREQLTNQTTQVPVLGSLPWVGFAFRQTKETTERREVLVLITPRIVYEPGTCQEGAKGACEFLRRQSTYADKMSPFGKRSIARRYYRLAERAYAEGDMNKALRFAEMSVQFDPLDRAALELRSDIWLGKPYKGAAAVNGAPSSQPMEGAAMADWLIDDLEKPATPPAPAAMHPLDPGVPGRHTNLVQPKVLQ
ncbi:MAG: hypothetical protein ABFC77_11175 [Thermoguttaceae bacterium]